MDFRRPKGWLVGVSGLGMQSLPPKPEEFEHVVLVMRNEMTEAEWCLPENDVGNWGRGA